MNLHLHLHMYLHFHLHLQLHLHPRKEQQLRGKTGAAAADSVLIPNMTFGHR